MTSKEEERRKQEEENLLKDELKLGSAGADALKFLMEKAYDAYQADNERFWKMVNFVSLVNGGLLVLLATSKEPIFWLAASVVGASLCTAWYGMQQRYAWWCGWWDKRVGELEKAYLAKLIPPEAGDGPFTSHSKPKGTPRGRSTRGTTRLIPMSFGIAWVAIAVSSLLRLASA